jgi:DNA-binding NarL/FixJ family response regulator
VLQLLAEGHSSKDIAVRLRLSIKTVQTHREHIMESLGIHSVVGLAKYSIREGLTSSDPDRDD